MGSTGLHESYWEVTPKRPPRWRLWAMRVLPYSWFLWVARQRWLASR